MNKLVSGTCLGLFLALTVSTAMAQTFQSSHTHCRAGVREYLVERGVNPKDIVSIDLRAENRSLTAVDSFGRKRQVTWQAWARVKGCEQSMRFRLDQFCRVTSSDIPKACSSGELGAEEESDEGLLDIFKRDDTK